MNDSLPDDFEPMNMDAANHPDEFREMAEQCDALSRVYKQYARYASLKHVACVKRSCGKVEQATRAERDADRLYREIPERARW